MDRERVQQLFDSYGGEPALWPAQERESALSLIREDSALQAQQRAAAALDQWLDALPSEAVNPQLTQRILAQLPPTPAGHAAGSTARSWLSALRAAWQPLLLACAPLALGVIIGAGNLPAGSSEQAWTWQDEEQLLFAYHLAEPVYE